MQKHNLRELVEYGDKGVLRKVLVNQPGYRVVFANLRAGQSVPEHATPETVTVNVVSGRITFFGNGVPQELRAGEVLWCEANARHSIQAHEDSSLLVVAARVAAKQEEEIDVRTIDRFNRHPFIFAKFDALGVGESFQLVNDHDPMPLHRQMETMRPNQVSWEYIVRGPEIYRICVKRVAPPTGSEAPLTPPSETVPGIQSAR